MKPKDALMALIAMLLVVLAGCWVFQFLVLAGTFFWKALNALIELDIITAFFSLVIGLFFIVAGFGVLLGLRGDKKK